MLTCIACRSWPMQNVEEIWKQLLLLIALVTDVGGPRRQSCHNCNYAGDGGT